jgi:hypothetical protein
MTLTVAGKEKIVESCFPCKMNFHGFQPNRSLILLSNKIYGIVLKFFSFLSRAAIHKRFGAREKTGSELIFLRIDSKISFFQFLQMLFTKNVGVWRISSRRLIFLEKN